MDNNSSSRQAEKMRFVEDMALIYEGYGMSRMAGRILTWLLICDPPYQSSGELVEALRASKGSISTATRFLIQFKLIERIAMSGKRGDYFRVRPEMWTELLKAKEAGISIMRKMAERGLKLIEDESPKTKERLQEFHDLYGFFEKEFPAMLKRWEQQRRQ